MFRFQSFNSFTYTLSFLDYFALYILLSHSFRCCCCGWSVAIVVYCQRRRDVSLAGFTTPSAFTVVRGFNKVCWWVGLPVSGVYLWVYKCLLVCLCAHLCCCSCVLGLCGCLAIWLSVRLFNFQSIDWLSCFVCWFLCSFRLFCWLVVFAGSCRHFFFFLYFWLHLICLFICQLSIYLRCCPHFIQALCCCPFETEYV